MFSANSSQVSDSKLFVEDVFSTYLYAGNGGTQTITNGIDLAGKGGMVWIKNRNASSDPLHYLNFKDGSNIVSNNSNNTSAKQVMTPYAAFNSDGFFVNALPGFLNNSGVNYASWTFREAPKFFDVVTYTGTGSFFRDLSHSLGVAPGFIVVKRTDTTSNWWTYHRGVLGSINGYLNLTDAFNNIGYVDPSPTPAATFRVFNTGAGDDLNVSGATYVAYLYAHDATSDGIIQCGTYTETGSAVTVNLGWEPQWLMVKRSNGTGNWVITDNMRAFNMSTTNGAVLFPNTSGAETNDPYWHPTATGFVADPYWGSGASVVYIAIRRGPMRTPTLGTSVFAVDISNENGSATSPEFVSNFPVDMYFLGNRTNSGGADKWYWMDRLRGNVRLNSATTAAESSFSVPGFAFNTGVFNSAITSDYYATMFRRAPGFMDVVCYTGNGVNGRTINHNLGVTPELMIMKNRSSAGYNWFTWDKSADLSQANALLALSNAAGRPAFSSGNLNSTVPTSTVFTIGGDSNASGGNYVTYLFASCPGVSKVGSYTGNGSSQTINCGFAAGARFVMIKRTDSTGDWYVWDTARGIVTGNDPHLSLNTTAAEVTTDDTIDTDSSGFVVNQVSATDVNVSSATYIYLAIA